MKLWFLKIQFVIMLIKDYLMLIYQILSVLDLLLKHQKKRRIIKNTDLLFGRTYEDYLDYIKDNESLVVQLDTVVGKLIDKKKILTIHWPTFHFQIGILLDSLNPINVNNALIKLKNDIGEELYRSLFQTIVNISERAIKPFVIARKNFLFHATSHGASSSAIIFSLQQTARANLLDPEKYISKVLELIKPNMSDDELDSLLPWNIAKKFILSQSFSSYLGFFYAYLFTLQIGHIFSFM